jgi:hypothetical protein
MEYYSVIKKNEILLLAASRMELGIIVLIKLSLAQKDKYHMFFSHIIIILHKCKKGDSLRGKPMMGKKRKGKRKGEGIQ